MDVRPFLNMMVEKKASDLFITAGFPPSAKIDGELRQLSENRLTPEQSLVFVESLMSDVQKKEFHDTSECNFAFAAKDLGRFRVSAFWQRESAGCVMRRIETQIPEVDDLKLPPMGYRNAHARGHILTIEDPVEFVHNHRKSIVTQREVGIDTDSFDAALKSSLRQAPDVILIGEIRTQETMEFALSFAETGHLCMATLHANNANQALDRIMHLVPESKHNQLLFDLSLNLRGIVAQQLIPKSDGTGRRAAIEVLINTPRVASLIAKNELHLLKETMGKSREQGMQTFDQALLDLYVEGEISYADALHHADSPNDLRLMIKLRNNEAASSGSMEGITLDMD